MMTPSCEAAVSILIQAQLCYVLFVNNCSSHVTSLIYTVIAMPVLRYSPLVTNMLNGNIVVWISPSALHF
jgi:hypothetical protein